MYYLGTADEGSRHCTGLGMYYLGTANDGSRQAQDQVCTTWGQLIRGADKHRTRYVILGDS